MNYFNDYYNNIYPKNSYPKVYFIQYASVTSSTTVDDE